jgi:tRNA nucleotidyltransferase (CCA-adding enzyme)
LSPDYRELFDRVVEAAASDDVPLFLVGGPVRDWLAERPLRDLDFCIESKTLSAAGEFARRAASKDAVFEETPRFGTARIALGELHVDIACTRSERYAKPGALPRVEAAPLEVDLGRRDFSVNAMAIPLTRAARQGRDALVDPLGGARDLASRRLRPLHERSFHDDPTRALRAARFSARENFRLVPEALGALRSALRDGAFGAVSGARYRREFELLFEDAARGSAPAKALGQLASWHVLPAIEPGLAFPKRAQLPLRRLSKALFSPPWPTDAKPLRAGLMLWLAALGRDWPERVLARLDMRGEPARRLAGFCSGRARMQKALTGCRGRGAVDALLAGCEDAAILALFCSSGPEIRRRVLRFALEDRQRQLPLDGADLSALGFRGREIAEALARLRCLFLDGRFKDREAGLTLARELLEAGTPTLRKRE